MTDIKSFLFWQKDVFAGHPVCGFVFSHFIFLFKLYDIFVFISVILRHLLNLDSHLTKQHTAISVCCNVDATALWGAELCFMASRLSAFILQLYLYFINKNAKITTLGFIHSCIYYYFLEIRVKHACIKLCNTSSQLNLVSSYLFKERINCWL